MPDGLIAYLVSLWDVPYPFEYTAPLRFTFDAIGDRYYESLGDVLETTPSWVFEAAKVKP